MLKLFSERIQILNNSNLFHLDSKNIDSCEMKWWGKKFAKMEPNLMRRGVRENKKFKFHSDLEESKELDQQKRIYCSFL